MVIALLACAPAELVVLDERPRQADAVVLLAQITPGLVTVEGVLDGVDHVVDVDLPEDDRYGFRYRVEDADGDALYTRSTGGPVIVQSFLDYWGAATGFDILGNLPTLGRFPVQVPLLDGADRVVFEVRDDSGEYRFQGQFELADLDARRVTPLPDLVRRTEALNDAGDPRGRLDVAIIGDGYTEEELGLFRDHADEVANKLLRTEPFASFEDHVNIVRVDVASAESGASFDCPDCGYVENAFGSIFALELVNRTMGTTYSSRAIFQADQWKVAHALADVPWDAVIVLVNSPAYGGMAVHYATVTTGMDDFADTAVHELGHSFGLLGDEYVFDDCIRSGKVGLPENVTDDAEHPPWEDWIEAGAELPSPPRYDGVGAFAGAWNCPDLYRPEASCKMNDGGPFCAVCSELLVRRLMRFADPADDVAIVDRELVITGVLDGVHATVHVDGQGFADGPIAELPRLPRGAGDVRVELRLETDRVRSDPEDDLAESWSFGPLAD